MKSAGSIDQKNISVILEGFETEASIKPIVKTSDKAETIVERFLKRSQKVFLEQQNDNSEQINSIDWN